MPRGLTIKQAADHCGVTPDTFRSWVRDGLVPGPWPGTKRYDKRALDDALDKLSQFPQNALPYDSWKAKQNANSTEAH